MLTIISKKFVSIGIVSIFAPSDNTFLCKETNYDLKAQTCMYAL